MFFLVVCIVKGTIKRKVISSVLVNYNIKNTTLAARRRLVSQKSAGIKHRWQCRLEVPAAVCLGIVDIEVKLGLVDFLLVKIDCNVFWRSQRVNMVSFGNFYLANAAQSRKKYLEICDITLTYWRWGFSAKFQKWNFDLYFHF